MRSVPCLPTSIFGRLRVLLGTLFVTGAVVALAGAWLFSAATATESYDRLLFSAAAQIAGSIDVQAGALTVLPPDSAFETLALSSGDRFFFAVRAPDGSLLTGYPSLASEARGARSGVPVLGYRQFAGARVRTATLYRFIASAAARGWCSVVVAETLEARTAMVAGMMWKLSAVILLFGGIGFAAALGAARISLFPFEEIRRVLAGRKPQDLTPLKVNSPRESLALINAINELMERLNARMSKLQTFAAVAAHQIRTPLASLGAQTELLLLDRSAQARGQRVERLRQHISKLSRVTHQLLGQAMISYRKDTMPRERIQAIELAQAVLRDAVPHSLDRDITVDLRSEADDLAIEGDRLSLHEGLSNLVNNAITHGAPSALRIYVRELDGQVQVAVGDDGTGIAPQKWDLARLPFGLPREEGSGAGLGISIASEIAAAHGGTLGFAFAADGFFEVRLELPRCQ